MSARKDMAVWVAILTLTAGAGMVSASHKDGCRKYADALINWYNGGTGDYFNLYNEEAKTDADAWDPYTDVSLHPVAAAGTTDHVNAYNGRYGSTGWLVTVEVSYSTTTCIQTQARIRLNQSYLDNGSYTRANKKTYACNALGKALGLKSDPGSAGCMGLSAPHPVAHDREVINPTY
jgi:hypothetical protein